MPRAIAAWLDADLTLTPSELSLLRVLSRRSGRWVSNKALAARLKGEVFRPDDPTLVEVDTAAVRTHIWRMRKKLESSGWRIENRYFHGLYRLVPSDKR